MYDVIVIGARCAGSPLAMLLARRGHRVLVVDKDTFPSDTISTHFLWPRGASYLNRWGLLDRVLAKTPSATTLDITMEGITVSGEVPLDLLRTRMARLHGDSGDGVVQTYCSVRRTVLDTILVDAAREAGAEVRTGFRVDELCVDGGRVVGIRGRDGAGKPVTERARIVVGADGRRSFVARTLGLEETNVHAKCSFAYYGYYSGVAVPRAQLCRRGRLGLAVVPTNFDQHLVLTFGPVEWFHTFRANLEDNYSKAIEHVSPELAERVRQGRREHGLYGTPDQSAFWRKAHGPGWALVGDALCFKDQCTAMGMTHAFRDAALAADALGEGLSGTQPLEPALERFAAQHYLDGVDYYGFVCMQAEMNPARTDEIELVHAVKDDPIQTGRYIATFGDTLPLRSFMSRRSVQWIFRGRPAVTASRYREDQERLDRAALNPFTKPPPRSADHLALGKSAFDYARLQGRDLVARTEEYMRWVGIRRETGTWPYTRFLHSAPGPTARLSDESGRTIESVNFASQDYLSLTSHEAVHEAATKALRDFGPHSAGSAMGLGNTGLSRRLEGALAELLGMEHVLLFPTGWAAGFGSIAGLVQYEDHVLLDKYAHNCLTLGARSMCGNIERYEHLDCESLGYRLRDIRARDARSGILVVTEGLFSMESDSPRLREIQTLCHEHAATLLLDVAHDLGAMGPGGTGQLGIQRMLSNVDLVMGSFSKTFCSNGGFLASRSEGVKQYVKHFAGSHTYSNGLSPMQAAVVTAAIEVARSAEGDARRSALMRAIVALRSQLADRGTPAIGQPSPIVPVVIGDEKVARAAHRLLFSRNVGAQMVEFPVVESGAARFRLQVMANHTEEQAVLAANAVAEVLEEAEASVDAINNYTAYRPKRGTGARSKAAAPAPAVVLEPAD